MQKYDLFMPQSHCISFLTYQTVFHLNSAESKLLEEVVVPLAKTLSKLPQTLKERSVRVSYSVDKVTVSVFGETS